MSNDTTEQQQEPVVQPRAPRKRKQVEVEAPPFVDLLIATDDKDDYEIIKLNASDQIPAGGHPFGVNGRMFIMAAEVWYRVPSWLLPNIDNIIVEKPIKDEADRFVGTRSMKRFTYEIFRG